MKEKQETVLGSEATGNRWLMSTRLRVSPLLMGLRLCCVPVDKRGTCGPKLFFEFGLNASSLKNMGLCCNT